MASRKEAKKKSLLRVLALIIAVVIIVVASVLIQNWWNNRPGPQPSEVSITASVGEEESEIFPYLSCVPGTECPEGDIPAVAVGPDEKLHLDIPEPIHQLQWTLLKIYDDPAANDQVLHSSYDATTAEIAGSVDPLTENSTQRPQLVLVEVSAVMVGLDDNGEEAPFSVVWSISTQDEPGAKSGN